MTRRPLISANWKMNHNHFEAIQAVQKLAYLVPKELTEAIDVSIHPPFTDLRSIQTLIDADKLPFALGAQHCHWEDKGAFTGEVSAAFLAKLDVAYVICGHSERRELFAETDEMVAAKVTAIQRHGMTPIVCVGETLDEREQGATNDKVIGQIDCAVAGRTNQQIASMVVAYEPIWAIGTGRDSDGRRCPGRVRGDQGTGRPRHRPDDGGGDADPVRRVGELRKHRRADGRTRHRRRPRRRRQPRSRRVRQDPDQRCRPLNLRHPPALMSDERAPTGPFIRPQRHPPR